MFRYGDNQQRHHNNSKCHTNYQRNAKYLVIHSFLQQLQNNKSQLGSIVRAALCSTFWGQKLRSGVSATFRAQVNISYGHNGKRYEQSNHTYTHTNASAH